MEEKDFEKLQKAVALDIFIAEENIANEEDVIFNRFVIDLSVLRYQRAKRLIESQQTLPEQQIQCS